MFLSLDERFGPLIAPTRVEEWERNWFPKSLSKLDARSALSLQRHMGEISSGWSLGRVWCDDTLIIWVVDEGGVVWFAIEELIWKALPTGLPKFQRFPLTEWEPKLGHPSLIGGKSARIGGEIQFNISTLSWSINNGSGRYGYDPSRNARQLSNVAQIFAEFGIALKLHFYAPKGGRP